MGLEGWPLAVVICVVAVLVYAAFDTWYKQPYLSKQVNDMKIIARGDKAVDHVIGEYEDDKAHDVHHKGPIR